MKRLLPLLLVLLLLCGCSSPAAEPAATEPLPTDTPPVSYPTDPGEDPNLAYSSRFDNGETVISLRDTGMDVTGPNRATVFGSNDIIYYEDRDTYDSGNPYGEGTDADKHTAEEAARHFVVNITEPGAYRITGKLSAGQIRIDLGNDAYETATDVVELILDDADITCTAAPAIVFMNVYECDGDWSEDTAGPDVDTSYAGANLILEGNNTVTGSYVARIYKDKEGEKKLWKQDGAIYSYMSMNVYGPGSLTLNAANEGLDTELHLTVNGGDITILSQNDGINTNEDNVSVTTINGGNLRIVAGLGEEGDGIDSNGYLVINGGTVISAAKPAADSGLDSDKGSFIHGGTVIAMGAAMDWTESDSSQVTMNLQFAQQQKAGSKITVTREDGTEIFSFEDDGPQARSFSGLILSHPYFSQGETYQVYVDGVQMSYASTDVMGHGPGGFGGGFGGGKGQRPDGEMPDMPEGFDGRMPDMPEGEMPTMPEGFDGMQPPEGFDGKMPEDFDGEMPTMPEGQQRPQGDFGGRGDRGDRNPGGEAPADGQNPGGDRNPNAGQSTEPQTAFYMQDKVNFFSGLTAAK